MFTGIVRELGTVARIARIRGLTRLSIDAPNTALRIEPLESVAVNGVCLTVVNRHRGLLTFEVIRHTQQLTNLAALRAGDRVNLEPSLSLTDRLGGHVLFGHIDGLGKILRRFSGQGTWSLDIGLPSGVGPWVVPQGPIAVDGVSLTVGSVASASRIRVHLIPETLRQTTLASRAVGDRVNIEVDYLAKLTRHFLRHRPAPERAWTSR